MTLDDAQRVANGGLRSAKSGRLGNYYYQASKSHSVHLGFESGRLVSVTTRSLRPFSTDVRTSPKRNVCTGESTFLLRLQWVTALEGCDIYVDDSLVMANASSGLQREITAGEHVVRLEKPGFAPTERRFVLDDASDWEKEIDITEVERVDTPH